ncbi:unnamed protein product [marine sediment metagenome]|uniref:Uncharacterized protein n=1 Tax=marine sediment metagenome TaxID=412755 RepID=X1V2S0_9ZZZZ
MKILKVKIKKQRELKRCRYSYPKGWNAEKIHVLAYEDHPENLGNVEEDCLCVTDDATAATLLKQPEVKEITKNEADSFGRQWRPSSAIITDENKIIEIVRKLLAKPKIVTELRSVLTDREFNVLNEKKREPGVEKGKEFDINEFI